MLQQNIREQNALAGRPPVAPNARLTVEIAPECARFSFRAGPEARDEAGACFGVGLPKKIGELATTGPRLALCLGPDEWVLLAPAEDLLEIERSFRMNVKASHSLVDVSHRELGIEVRGPAATAALGAFCALDLDIMPSPSVTRTIFDKAQVILVKQAPDHYRIEVWQSFADHVWGLLHATSRETALGI